MSRLIIKPRKRTRYTMAGIGSIFPIGFLVLIASNSSGDILSLYNIRCFLVYLVFGLLLWLYFESSRYLIEDGYLSEKKFGLTLWKIHQSQAEIEEVDIYWYVSNRVRGKRIGKIYCVQFYPSDLQRLLDTLFPDAIREA